MILRNFLFTMDSITVVLQVDLGLVTGTKKKDDDAAKEVLF